MPKLSKNFFRLFFVSLLLVISLSRAGSALSQEETPSEDAAPTEAASEKTPFELQFIDYQTKMKDYDVKHQDYVIKRSQYLRFKTLTAQEDAYDATMAMLLSRNDVLVSYIRSLQEKMKEEEDIPGDIVAKLTLSTNDEIGWLTSHQNTTSTAGTLDDLVKDSKIAQGRYDQKQAVIAYESLATLSLGKVLGYTKRTEDLYDLLKKKIDVIRSETKEGYTFSAAKFQVLDRWLFDAETRITRAKQKNTDVATYFSGKNVKSQANSALGQYNLTLKTLGESQLFLKEANTFMGEVIRELKTAEK